MDDDKQRQKRRRKIAKNPKNVRFEDLRRLLEDYGFELKRTKGSHHSFVGNVGDEKVTVVIPFKQPLKQIYVKKVLAILRQIENLEKDEETEELEDSEVEDENDE